MASGGAGNRVSAGRAGNKFFVASDLVNSKDTSAVRVRNDTCISSLAYSTVEGTCSSTCVLRQNVRTYGGSEAYLRPSTLSVRIYNSPRVIHTSIHRGSKASSSRGFYGNTPRVFTSCATLSAACTLHTGTSAPLTAACTGACTSDSRSSAQLTVASVTAVSSCLNTTAATVPASYVSTHHTAAATASIATIAEVNRPASHSSSSLPSSS